jgi:glutathione S-transferase
MSGWGKPEDALNTLSDALKSRPWLLGDRFSAADVLTGSGLGYMMGFKVIPERPEYLDYVRRMQARPAYQAAQKALAG